MNIAFTLQTDALTPDLLRGDRLIFTPDETPESGDVAVIETPIGRLVRRVYFTPSSVTLEAPNAEPAAFRAEAVRFVGTVRAAFRAGRAVAGYGEEDGDE